MKIEILEEIKSAAVELAGYASYAEIVGGVSLNASQIREYCDKIFELSRRYDDTQPVSNTDE